jgi:purine-cytosine permease-like protein
MLSVCLKLYDSLCNFIISLCYFFITVTFVVEDYLILTLNFGLENLLESNGAWDLAFAHSGCFAASVDNKLPICTHPRREKASSTLKA